MHDIGYYNGVFAPLHELTVPANDRALYFGDGVYDAIWVRNGKPFTLKDHMDRLFYSCKRLEIAPPLTEEEFTSVFMQMIAQAGGGEGMLYVQVSRGTAPRSHAFPTNGGKANVLAYFRPMPMPDLKKLLRLITVEDTRFFHCDIKTLNLIPNVIATQRATEAGCDESVFCRGERVTECAHSGLAIFKDGVFQTAPLDNLILPSISRKHLIMLCNQLGIPVREEPFTRDELMAADEVMVMSTTSLVRRATEIDGKPVGGKATALFEKLQGAYWAWLQEECK